MHLSLILTVSLSIQFRLFFCHCKFIAIGWFLQSTSVSPDSKLLAVAGDSVDCLVADAKSGKVKSISLFLELCHSFFIR